MDTVRDDLRRFLREPAAFAEAATPRQRDAWCAGLDFARSAMPAGRALREAQVRAWQGSADRRAALILGPPGTGKTYLLAWMAAGFARACRASGRDCRILFTGFTRESIGNLFKDVARIAATHLPGTRLVFFGNPPDRPLPEAVDVLALSDDGLSDWMPPSRPTWVGGCRRSSGTPRRLTISAAASSIGGSRSSR